jgi:2-polyprenyl-3-methyl-5-hydroxy-6-metoxy-1,4-benzoquinol methylase
MSNRKATRSIKSFAEQHTLGISKIPPLSDDDFQSYRLHEVLPRELFSKSILDVGCGTCRLTSRLTSFRPSWIHCIDPSITSQDFYLYWKLQSPVQNQTSVSFSQISALEYKSQELFQIITILGVLHHIPEAISTLKNLRSCLDDNGIIILWLYSDNIGKLNLISLSFLRFIFPFFGRYRKHFCHCVLLVLKFLNTIYPSETISQLLNKTLEEKLLVLFDQLNAGYAKYYSENDIKEMASKSNLIVLEILNTGNKGWTVLLQKNSE